MAILINIENSDDGFLTYSTDPKEILNSYNKHTQAGELYSQFTNNIPSTFTEDTLNTMLEDLASESGTPEGPSYIPPVVFTPTIYSSEGGEIDSPDLGPESTIDSVVNDDVLNGGAFSGIAGTVIGGMLSGLTGPTEAQQALADEIDSAKAPAPGDAIGPGLNSIANLNEASDTRTRAKGNMGKAALGGLLTGGPVGLLTGIVKGVVGVSAETAVQSKIRNAVNVSMGNPPDAHFSTQEELANIKSLDFNVDPSDIGYSDPSEVNVDSATASEGSFEAPDTDTDVSFGDWGGDFGYDGDGDSSGGGATDGFEGGSDDHL